MAIRSTYTLLALTQILTVVGCDSASPPDAGTATDAASRTEAGPEVDAGSDAGARTDAGSGVDGGSTEDAGQPFSLEDIGMPCIDNTECVGGVCYSERPYNYVGGSCTTPCSPEARWNYETDTSCGPNARCQIGGWDEMVCMPVCNEDADCREGYRCEPYRRDSTFGVCYSDSSGAPPPPLPPRDLGAACTTDDNCDALCLTEARYRYPGGSCSAECWSDSDCGPDASCVVYDSREGEEYRCIAHCTSDADCRDDYYCNMENPSLTYCYPASYVGGHVFVGAGLTVTIHDAAGGTLTVTESQEFQFSHRYAEREAFNVTASIAGSPAGEVCTVSGGVGTIETDGVSFRGISVVCGKQAVFTDPGTTAWVVPAGVTSVSVVVVGAGGQASSFYGGGGGELCYANNLAVTPGDTLSVVVGNYVAVNDSSFHGVLARGGSSGRYAPGGTGGYGGTCFAGGSGGVNGAAGGAGGYRGVGGRGYGGPIDPPTDGEGGAGGGGSGGVGFSRGAGGAVGLEGIGANGVAPGGHGSQADGWVPVAGGGSTNYDGPQRGYHGGVRILWGAGRSYPDNAGNR